MVGLIGVNFVRAYCTTLAVGFFASNIRLSNL